MKQASEVLRLEKETAEKLAARAFAKSYLSDLVPTVFNNLRENNYFYDPVQRDLEIGCMPWLIDLTLNELDNSIIGRLLLDDVISLIVGQREEEYDQLDQAQVANEQQNEQSGENNVTENVEESVNDESANVGQTPAQEEVRNLSS
jgi:hypothetical protein